MKVITEDSRTLSFYDSEKLLCKLIHLRSYSSNAEIAMENGEIYRIESAGFWKNLFEVKCQGKVVVTLRKKWTGKTVLTTHPPLVSNVYSFEHRGLFNSRYVLFDKDEREMAVVRSKFRWKGLRVDFETEASDSLRRREGYLLLLVLTTYLARLMIRQHSSGVAAAT